VKTAHNNKPSEEIVMRFERDFKCTILCFNRPFMDVELVRGDQVLKIGRVTWYILIVISKPKAPGTASTGVCTSSARTMS
jgi:hypothetical protein